MEEQLKEHKIKNENKNLNVLTKAFEAGYNDIKSGKTSRGKTRANNGGDEPSVEPAEPGLC